MPASWSRAIIAVASLMSLVSAAPAVAVYPDPPPDPAHRTHPHSGMHSPARHGALPLLVVVVQLSDAPPPPGLSTAAQVRDRIFGGAPSAADYFEEVSGGHVRFVPAAETQGTRDDGIVFVDGGTHGTYFGDLHEEIRTAVLLADRYVDFRAFDSPTDSDSEVRADELTILLLRPTRPGHVDNGGVARALVTPTADGVDLAMDIATAGLLTNLATIVHEIAHAAFWLEDWYGFGIGDVDLAGPTIAGRELDRRPTGVQAAHLGWADPHVVTRDGWLELPPASSGRHPVGAVLYDPSVGINDHIFLENRQPSAHDDAYEGAVPDSGLFAYRVVDDRFFTRADEHVRPIELLLPGGRRSPGCDDEDVDGREDEDPPGALLRIIAGRVDLDRDGAVTSADDGSYLGVPVYDGRFDVRPPSSRTGVPTVFASGTVGSVPVIGGSIDVDGDGDIDGDDASALHGDPWRDVDNDRDRRTDEDAHWPGCYGGTDRDAWNPSDPSTPERSFGGVHPDGTRTPLAFRGVWPPDEDGDVRVYADVRGPGVMLDTFEAMFHGTSAGRHLPRVRAGDPPTNFWLVVRNTGEPEEGPDTFEVSVEPPSSAWSAGTTSVTLAPGDEERVWVTLGRAPTHAGGEFHMTAVAQSTTRPTVRSASPLSVEVIATNRTPDPFDASPPGNNEPLNATPISWHVHRHAALPFGGTERWSSRFGGVNLHRYEDSDYYEMHLPDYTDPTAGGHAHYAGVAACGTTETSTGRIVATEVLEGRVRPDPSTAELDNVFITWPEGGYATWHHWGGNEYSIPCVRELSHTSALLRVAHRTESTNPAYEVELGYRFETLHVPEHAEFLADQQKAYGVGSVLNWLCAGGAFPNCFGLKGPKLDFELQHPALPGRDCVADGCPDHLAFAWATGGDLHLDLETVEGVDVTLFDVHGTAIATSGNAPPDADQMSTTPSGKHEGDDAHGGHPTTGDGTPSEVQAPSVRSRILSAPQLEPGVYVLVVRGPAGPVRVRTPRPPSVVDVELTLPSEPVAETVREFERVVTVTNRDAKRVVVIAAITDEHGGSHDDTNCVLPQTLSPGEKLTCATTQPLPGGPGPYEADVEVYGSVGDLSVRGAAVGTLNVADELPAGDLALQVTPPTLPEPGGVLTLTAKLRNTTAEEMVLERVHAARVDDADGDGRAGDTEAREVAVPCEIPDRLDAGASWDCTWEVDVQGHEFTDPRFTLSAVGADDDGNGWVTRVGQRVDIVGQGLRRLDAAASSLELRVEPGYRVEHGIDGYVTTASGQTNVAITAWLAPRRASPAPDGQEQGRTGAASTGDAPAVLVTEVAAEIPGAESLCAPTDRGPVVVTGRTAVQLWCVVEGDLPLGASVRVTAGGVGQTIELTAPTVADVTIDAVPGSELNPVKVTKGGVVPVAVITEDGFDARWIDPSTVCFGNLVTGGACEEKHGMGHVEDVDGDGDLDLVLHYEAEELGFTPAQVAQACLRATTRAGHAVGGCDLVRPR